MWKKTFFDASNSSTMNCGASAPARSWASRCFNFKPYRIAKPCQSGLTSKAYRSPLGIPGSHSLLSLHASIGIATAWRSSRKMMGGAWPSTLESQSHTSQEPGTARCVNHRWLWPARSSGWHRRAACSVTCFSAIKSRSAPLAVKRSCATIEAMTISYNPQKWRTARTWPGGEWGVAMAQVRKSERLTQHDVADYLGVSLATVRKWETGLALPDRLLWPKVEEAMGVPIPDPRVPEHTPAERELIDTLLLMTDELRPLREHLAEAMKTESVTTTPWPQPQVVDVNGAAAYT